MGATQEDTTGLERFLAEKAFPGADEVQVIDERRPAVGSSWETFFLTLAVRRGPMKEERRIVVKRAPDDGPLAPYRADKDGIILASLDGSDVPHPKALAWTLDRSVFARPISVSEFVEGENEDLARIERWPLWQQRRPELGAEIIATLAKLQGFRWQETELPSVLSWDGKGGSAAERMVATVDKWLRPYGPYYRGEAELPGPGPLVWEEVGVWLKENVADLPEDELVIVHGDFRFGNLIWQGTKVAAIVDWERTTLGDPMSDLGFICMPFSRLRDPQLMGKALRYEEVVSLYEQATGRPVDRRRLQYYSIFWEWIEGCQGGQPRIRMTQSDRTGGTLTAMRRALPTSSGWLTHNLNVRHTLELIERFERGDHDVVV